jgi:hypothetical protein
MAPKKENMSFQPLDSSFSQFLPSFFGVFGVPKVVPLLPAELASRQRFGRTLGLSALERNGERTTVGRGGHAEDGNSKGMEVDQEKNSSMISWI